MDPIAKQLHASIALNLFAEAARLCIPLLRQEHEEIANAAACTRLAGGYAALVAYLQGRADELLEAVMVSEIALKEAGPLVKPAVRVVDHLDGNPRNYERSNLIVMVTK